MTQEVRRVSKGCPLCSADVVGNEKIRYYCKTCNLLFSEESLQQPSSGTDKTITPIMK